MSFSSTDSIKNIPLQWFIQKQTDGGKMTFELQDEMKKKGVSKRVLFDPADSTWTMLIAFNKIKQGSRIHAGSMYSDTIKHIPLIVKSTREKKIINGYSCNKIILESEENIAEGWVTKEIKFDLCQIYKLLSHCGMMNEYIQKGDWYFANSNNMIVELNSRNKETGKIFSLKISNILPGDMNENFFKIDDFKIADIPEGLNCGISVKE
jgi:glucan-binding YG repeat protein